MKLLRNIPVAFVSYRSFLRLRNYKIAACLLLLLCAGSNATVFTQDRSPAVQAIAESQSAFSEFNNWARSFNEGKTTARMAAKGEQLAKKRRRALKRLMRKDPEAALSQAMSFEIRQYLPEAVARHLEIWVDGVGDLYVNLSTPSKENDPVFVERHVQLNGNEYVAHVYGRLESRSYQNIPIHGIVIDKEMAVLDSPLRRLEAGELRSSPKSYGMLNSDRVDPVSGNPSYETVTALVGDKVVFFESQDNLAEYEQELIASHFEVAAEDPFTHGPKKVLVMRVEFPNLLGAAVTEADALTRLQQVSDFYFQNSYGKTWFETRQATPLLMMPKPTTDYVNCTNCLMSDARAAAASAGFNTANFNFDIVSFQRFGYSWSGLGRVRGKGAWINGSFGFGVVAHELGHNYGLQHAGSAECNDQVICSSPVVSEYGDRHNVMGGGSPTKHFSLAFKNILGWLPGNFIQSVTASGVYRIFTHDQASIGGLTGLNISTSVDRNYYIGFQTRSDNQSLRNGAVVHLLRSNKKTWLLDMTPASLSGTSDFNDPALVVGTTYTDAEAGFSITTLAEGGSPNTTTNYLDIQVTLNRVDRSPVVQFTSPLSGATLSGRVAYGSIEATAGDPDAGSANGAGIANVVFQLVKDGQVVNSRTETSAPYQHGSFNTRRLANGAYTLRATATSTAAAGGTTSTTEITVNIRN